MEALLADYEQMCERATTVANKVEEARVEAEAKAQELARQLAQQAEEEREVGKGHPSSSRQLYSLIEVLLSCVHAGCSEQRTLAAQREEEKGKAQAAEEEAKRRAQEEADAHALALEAEKTRNERLAREAAEAEATERVCMTVESYRTYDKEVTLKLVSVSQERARLRAEDDALVASVPPGVPGIEQNLDALRQSCGDPKVQ